MLTETVLQLGQALDGYIDLKRNVLSPSTIHGYGIIRRNRLQSIMDIDIHQLDSFMMQKAINEDAVKSSHKSINEAKNLIVTALKLYGVKLELNVTLPAKKPKIKELPTPQQVIQMVRGTNIELPCMLAIWLSLRISEVRGLQFGDLKDGVLTIQRSKLRLGSEDVVREVNKTYSSTRQLIVPQYLIKSKLARSVKGNRHITRSHALRMVIAYWFCGCRVSPSRSFFLLLPLIFWQYYGIIVLKYDTECNRNYFPRVL